MCEKLCNMRICYTEKKRGFIVQRQPQQLKTHVELIAQLRQQYLDYRKKHL